MRRMLLSVIGAASLAAALPGGPLSAQTAPDIQFDSTVVQFILPDDIHLGEVAGVATNSSGHIFVYTRTGNPYLMMGVSRTVSHGGSRLLEFDAFGRLVRELGQGSYGMLYAQQVRVDRQDNLWAVDQASGQVMKFGPNGRINMVLSRKPEAFNLPQAPGAAGGRGGAAVPEGRGAAPAAGGAAPGRGAAPPAGAAGGGRGAGAPGGGAAAAGGAGARGQAPGGAAAGAPAGRGRGGPPGAGTAGESFNRPTDVAWDSTGNIYVADGIGNNNRIAKYDPNGKWIKNWGSTGTGNDQFTRVHGIAIDAQNRVYVADQGNRRIQVFDTEGVYQRTISNVGAPQAICISPGQTQYLYVSNSNPTDNIDVGGEIYKLSLDGKVIGKFGRAGKIVKEFGTANAIDCRTDNVLLIGEIGNYRVQRVTLK